MSCGGTGIACDKPKFFVSYFKNTKGTNDAQQHQI
jgi:hypothetical protein